MALSALSTLSLTFSSGISSAPLHEVLLQVNPKLCSGLSSRSHGIEGYSNGFGFMRKRRRNVLCALFAKVDRRRGDLSARAQATGAAGAPKFRTIGQLNEAIRESDSVQKAIKLLEDTKSDGFLAPNEATYASLMLLCRKLRQAERALVIYEAMKQAKEPISIRTYNTLLSCCQQSFRLEDALRIKKEIIEAGVTPDVVTFTTLMDIVVKTNPYRSRATAAERLRRALELFKEMESYSVAPDIKTYNTVIMAASEANEADKALDLYRDLVKAGLSATDFTFELLLKCLGSGGRLKAAIQVYNEARAAGIALQARTYNFLIAACASSPPPQAKRAWSFFEEMLANKDVKPTAQTYMSLITASSKADDNEGVMKAFKMMKDYGLTQSMTTSAYNQILGAASRSSLDDTFKIFEEMKKAGHIANSQTYECLMSACIRNKDFRRAEAVKEEFKDLDVSKNLSVANSLIRAFGDAGKWDESLKIFRDIIKKGLKPNEATFANVFDACYPRSDVAVLNMSDTTKIEITPGLDAAVSLYKEHKDFLKNFSNEKLERLDIRNLSPPGIVVATIAWLEHIRENPPTTDLIVVTGNRKEEIEGTPAARPKRTPKRHVIAQRILRGFGLPVSRLDTLATLTLFIQAEGVKEWVQGPDPFGDGEVVQSQPSSSAGSEPEPQAQASTETEKEARTSTETEKAAVDVHTSGRTQVVEVPVLDDASELVVQIKKATAPMTEEQAELVVQVKKAENKTTSADD